MYYNLSNTGGLGGIVADRGFPLDTIISTCPIPFSYGKDLHFKCVREEENHEISITPLHGLSKIQEDGKAKHLKAPKTSSKYLEMVIAE